MHNVVFVFIDGIGIGPRDQESNPLASFDGKILRFFREENVELPDHGTCIPTDACLGVEGVPQSATGQTTLFTGINAAEEVGRHVQAYPSGKLRQLIASQSIFRKLTNEHLQVTFANAYTPRYFEKRPRWVSATTHMCESAEIPLRTMENLGSGAALFMDFTNRTLLDLGFDVPVNSPAQAAEILVNLGRDYDLCLYEFFLTDLVGHRGTLEEAVILLKEVDEFLAEVVARTNSGSLIVTSDHGNIEDMSHGLHTRNPVPTLLWGNIQKAFPPPTHPMSLVDIAPRIEDHFNGQWRPREGS
jgi:2,3-bisphosphoglycerate-independent phosphoglycerate mutase